MQSNFNPKWKNGIIFFPFFKKILKNDFFLSRFAVSFFVCMCGKEKSQSR